jgi:CHASE2 domain-containing sensor protein
VIPDAAAWLIYLGAGLLLVAYAIRDELQLRVMIIVSTFVYIAYYYLLPTGPLWPPIVTSLLMVVVNIWVLGQIALERTTLRLSGDERALFDAFETLTPGSSAASSSSRAGCARKTPTARC